MEGDPLGLPTMENRSLHRPGKREMSRSCGLLQRRVAMATPCRPSKEEAREEILLPFSPPTLGAPPELLIGQPEQETECAGAWSIPRWRLDAGAQSRVVSRSRGAERDLPQQLSSCLHGGNLRLSEMMSPAQGHLPRRLQKQN